MSCSLPSNEDLENMILEHPRPEKPKRAAPNAKEAYDAGSKAKRQGFGRVSPYYNQPRSDYWWLAGFDGVEFFEAEKTQPEFEAA